jgi:hypothetical protein
MSEVLLYMVLGYKVEGMQTREGRSMRARREHLKWFYRKSYCKRPKPRPESGLDCLMCSKFTRER